MSVTIRARGTSYDSFRIGNSGPTITSSGRLSAPSSANLVVATDGTKGLVLTANSGTVASITTTNQTLSITAPAIRLNGATWPAQNGQNGQVLTTDGAGGLQWAGVSFTQLTNRPTTATGYGITDAVLTSGDQSIAGNKTFTSTIVGNISGNAGSVTNGVYTSGNQTIAGVKTFSNSPVVPAGATGAQVPQAQEIRALAILTPSDITSTTGTVANGEHKKLVNSGSTTVIAPGSAAVGHRWRVSVLNGRVDNVINWNGLKHEGRSDATLVLDIADASVEWEYASASYGWKRMSI